MLEADLIGALVARVDVVYRLAAVVGVILIFQFGAARPACQRGGEAVVAACARYGVPMVLEYR